MKLRNAGRWILAGALTAVLVVHCGGESPEPFTYSIEPSLAAGFPEYRESERGDRPLVASRDRNGVVSVFVANEVILGPASQAELDALLARYNGTVIETNAIPAPPARLGVTLTPEEMAPTEYVIRLDPSAVTLETFVEDAEAAGFEGERALSSEGGAKLMALLMRERRQGAEVSPNYVYFPGSPMLIATEEHPAGGGFLNAFSWPSSGLRFDATMAGSKSGVLEAWQFLRAHGIERRVNVAIIDDGFWLDNQGFPGSVLASGISDLHEGPPPAQYDFDGDDNLAGGPNPAKCTGGNPCPWHGNDSASVATAMADNQYGAAGTGGWVSNPILFKTDLTRSEVRRAVRTAVAWGADVVSMSFSGHCNLDCAMWPGTAGIEIWAAAQTKKTVFIACAGNDDHELGDLDVYPCQVLGVICVGALNDGSNTRAGFSNYGTGVDIYAPTNIATTPNPASQPNLSSGGGTSASAPFVAGIAAMMKAIDPALDSAQVWQMLKESAWTDSPDSRVGRYVNAFAAVKAAAGNALPPDPLEPNDTKWGASKATLNQPHMELTIRPGDSDFFRFELQDYAEVAIELQYMAGLGFLGATLLENDDQGPPVEQLVTTTNLGKTYRMKLMPPGLYRFRVGGTALNHYHMAVNAYPKALEPDEFEVNDTFFSAALPAHGSHLVNLHVDSDTDFYRFEVPTLALLEEFEFAIVFADSGPLGVNFLKLGTSPTPGTVLNLNQPGIYTAQVSGPKATRYVFSLGRRASRDLLPDFPTPVEDYSVLDPTDSLLRWLLGDVEGFVFTQSASNLRAYEGLELVGEGLSVTLFNAEGAVIAEGEKLTGPDAGVGQQLSFENTVKDAMYVLLVEREGAGAMPEGAVRPMIEYRLSWTSY